MLHVKLCITFQNIISFYEIVILILIFINFSIVNNMKSNCKIFLNQRFMNKIFFLTCWQFKQESFDSAQVLQKLCPQGIINVGLCSGASCRKAGGIIYPHFNILMLSQYFLFICRCSSEFILLREHTPLIYFDNLPFKRYCTWKVILLHTNTTEFSTFCVKSTDLHLFSDQSYSHLFTQWICDVVTHCMQCFLPSQY